MTQLQQNNTALEKLIYQDLHSIHGLFPDDIFLYSLKTHLDFRKGTKKKKHIHHKVFSLQTSLDCLCRESLHKLSARIDLQMQLRDKTVGVRLTSSQEQRGHASLLILQQSLAKSLFSVFLSFLQLLFLEEKPEPDR